MQAKHSLPVAESKARCATRGTKRGFTLIEVLVVVAIIALLVSILLPSLSRAREQTRAVTCSVNMRTCYQALLMYAQTSNDCFPWDATPVKRDNPHSPPAGANPWEFFHKIIQKGTPSRFTQWEKCPRITSPPANKFYASLDWYLCPKDQYYHTSSQTAERVFPDGSVMEVEYMLSYCVTYRVGYYDATWNGTATILPYKMSSVRPPSDKVIFSEFHDDLEDLAGANKPLADVPTWKHDVGATLNQGPFEVRHMDGANAIYLDGHNQFHRKSRTSQWKGLPSTYACVYGKLSSPLVMHESRPDPGF